MMKYLHLGEEIILSLLLTAMIGLSCLQIILRQFFDSGLPWADPLLRHLVVWGGFFGAMLAVSQDKHISLDIVGTFLPPRLKSCADLISSLFATVVCAVLTYASWLFLGNEIAFGRDVLLSLPSWAWNLVFPLTFAVMTLRYAAKAARAVRQLIAQYLRPREAVDK